MEAIHWPVKRFRLGENPFGRVTRPKESWLTVSVMVLWRKAQEEEVFEKTANLNRFVKSKRPMGHKSEAPNLCGLRRLSVEESTVNRKALVFFDREHAPQAPEEETRQQTR